MPIKVWGQLLGRQREMGVSKKFLDSSITSVHVVDDGIHLDSITRREENAFLDARIRTQSGEGLSETTLWNSELLSDLDRGCLMAQSNDDQMHGAITPIS
jgi:hypothetical protein